MTTVHPAEGRPADFRRALQTRVLLGDGAMGTLLQERGVPADACLEALNLSRPEVVRAIHAEYVAAGADFLQTNTFGASRIRLAPFSLSSDVERINREGVRLARAAAEAAGRAVYVAGDIGPLDAHLEADQARTAFEEQARWLADEGVDLFLLETFTVLAEARAALAAVKAAAPEHVVVAQMSFDADGLVDGLAPPKVAALLTEAGADVVGMNCGEGPKQAQRLLGGMARKDGVGPAVQPSAGLPQLVKRRVVYTITAEEMAEHARAFAASGAAIIGGCCGTTPRHIAAMQRALRGSLATASMPAPPPRGLEEKPPRPAASLREKLAAGDFVLGVEIDPPKGLKMASTVAAARRLKEAGIDFANVGDSPLAEVRMGPIATANILSREAGLETVVHYSTRDRNIMALQSDLMGAHALSLRNFLCIKGDPHALGSYTKAAAVWDVSALGLMRILKGLNAGRDALGNEVDPAASFLVGAAVNPGANDLEAEVALFHRKVNAGADFFLTQAVFSAATLERFVEKLGADHPPLILGIWPIHSQRQTEFLDRHITRIPDGVRAAIEGAGDGAQAKGFEMAAELMRASAGLVQGFYFIPSFRRFQEMDQLLLAAREMIGPGTAPSLPNQ